jgi:hypothetical protein
VVVLILRKGGFGGFDAYVSEVRSHICIEVMRRYVNNSTAGNPLSKFPPLQEESVLDSPQISRFFFMPLHEVV